MTPMRTLALMLAVLPLSGAGEARGDTAAHDSQVMAVHVEQVQRTPQGAAPRIESVSPDPYMPGRTRLQIHGTGFVSGTMVVLRNSSHGDHEISLASPQAVVVSPTEIAIDLLAQGGANGLDFGLGGSGAVFAVQAPGGQRSNEVTVGARPVTLHVVYQTHLDIGYNGAPSEVAQRYKRFYDDVVRMIDADAWPQEDGKVHFTVETLWQLEQFIARSAPAEVAHFMDLVRAGRIEVCAGYNTPSTASVSYEDLMRLFEVAAQYREDYGIPIETAIFNDQPGYSWGLADVAAGSGVRYLLSGINLWKGQALPGNPFPLPDRPLWWVGRSGNRVLFWPSIGEQDRGGRPWDTNAYKVVGGGAYGAAASDFGLAIVPPEYQPLLPPGWEDQYLEARVLRGLGFFADRDYPYDDILVPAANADNNWGGVNASIMGEGWPFKLFSWMTEAARRVNAMGRDLRVKITTPTPFFKLIESHGPSFAQIPAPGAGHGGDWPSIWENGDAGAVRSMARIRSARDLAPTAEKLAALASLADGGSAYPSADLKTLWQLIREWDEHTCPNGTVNGEAPGALTYEEVLQHDMEHVGFAKDAGALAHRLAEQGLAVVALSLASPQRQRIVVFNPTSWARSDVVRVAVPDGQPFALVDLASGEEVTCQRSAAIPGQTSFLAWNVPPNGYRLYELVSRTPAPPRPSGLIVDAAHRQIENGFYRITMTSDGYPAEVYDKTVGRDLIDHQSPYPFLHYSGIGAPGAYLNGFGLATVPHRSLDQPLGEIKVGEAGPVAASLVSIRPGAPQSRTEIRLVDGIRGVDFLVTIAPDALQLIDGQPTAWFMPFPFALDPARLSLRLDSPAGYLDPFKDQIPSTYNDFIYAVHGLRANDGTVAIELGCAESPIWDLPTAAGTVGMVQGMADGRQRPPFATLLNWTYWADSPRLMTFKSGPPDDPGDQDPATPGYQAYPIREPGLSGPFSLSYTLRSSPDSGFRADSTAPFLGTINNPLLAVGIEPSPALRRSASLASIVKTDTTTVEVSALKQARDRRGYIVRLREIAGRASRVALTSDIFDVVSARRVNLVEEEEVGLPAIEVRDGNAYLDIGVFGTATVRIDGFTLKPIRDHRVRRRLHGGGG